MYKVVNAISPEIMNEVFKLREDTHYHLRHTTQFLGDPVRSIFNSSESDSDLGPNIWEQVPTEIKNKDSFVEFQKEIKKWKPLN